VPVFGGALGHAIDEAVQRATGGGFWGTVLVARKGEVVLAKGYGFADYAERPNAPDTLFELASASKQMTAAAVLRLEQQGKLGTSDALGAFFRDVPDDKKAITVHQLLTHTSGISPEIGVPYDSPIGRAEYVRSMLAHPLASAPGEAFAYSNVGYALLAAIVEVASGKSFEEYARKELFAPAGLVDTGFVSEERLVRSDRVSRRLGDGPKEWTAANWHWGWGYRGMGGVVTTALDLLRWDRALRGDKVLGGPAKQKLHAPEKNGYACGWMIETTERGTTRAHHSGGVTGYASQVSRWLEEDVLVVILTNGKSDLGAVERAITALLFPASRIEADVDVGTHELSAFRALERKEGLAWQAAREGDRLRLSLRLGDATVAEIRMPKAYAAKLAADLERALSAYPDDPGGPPAMEGGVYLAAYPAGTKRLHLDADLAIRIQPRYDGIGADGKPIADLRPVFVLDDRKNRMWPVMVKMNVVATRALLDAVRKASA
jgi:CubicO group peptidase (beta-lactamase class C family)